MLLKYFAAHLLNIHLGYLLDNHRSLFCIFSAVSIRMGAKKKFVQGRHNRIPLPCDEALDLIAASNNSKEYWIKIHIVTGKTELPHKN